MAWKSSSRDFGQVNASDKTHKSKIKKKKRVTVHFLVYTIRQCDIFPLIMNMVHNDDIKDVWLFVCHEKWQLLQIVSRLGLKCVAPLGPRDCRRACVCMSREWELSLSVTLFPHIPSCCVYESRKMSIFSRRSFGASTGVSVCDVISSLLKVTPRYECLRWRYDEVSVCLWRLRITDKGNQPQIEF